MSLKIYSSHNGVEPRKQCIAISDLLQYLTCYTQLGHIVVNVYMNKACLASSPQSNSRSSYL